MGSAAWLGTISVMSAMSLLASCSFAANAHKSSQRSLGSSFILRYMQSTCHESERSEAIHRQAVA